MNSQHSQRLYPLLTNIPLNKTIHIFVEKLFEENNHVYNLSKEDSRTLLSLATKHSIFTFDGTLCKQVDGVAMGSPLGPDLTNAFLSHYERTWLDDCPVEFKPVFYKRYVDDVFVLLSSPNCLGAT